MPLFGASLVAVPLVFERWLGRSAPMRESDRSRRLGLALALICGVGFLLGAAACMPKLVLLVLLHVVPSCITLSVLGWLVWRAHHPGRTFGVDTIVLLVGWLFVPGLAFMAHRSLGILARPEDAQDAAIIWALPGFLWVPAVVVTTAAAIYVRAVLLPRAREATETGP